VKQQHSAVNIVIDNAVREVCKLPYVLWRVDFQEREAAPVAAVKVAVVRVEVPELSMLLTLLVVIMLRKMMTSMSSCQYPVPVPLCMH